MATIDLLSYNLGELKRLQHDTEIEIKNRQQQELQKARDQILAIAREAGVSVDELLATNARKAKAEKGQKVKPQYQDPKDGSQTWTGRGRQPKWIAEGLASGKTLDDFRI